MADGYDGESTVGQRTARPAEKPVVSDAARAAMRTFPEERSDSDLDSIAAWIESTNAVARLFNLMTMSADARRDLARNVKLLNVQRGALIYKQGDAGSSFFVVLEGACEVRHKPFALETDPRGRAAALGVTAAVMVDPEDRSHMGVRVGTIPAGECFGERVHASFAPGAEAAEAKEATFQATGRRPANVISLGAAKEDGTIDRALVLQVDAQAFRYCKHRLFQKVEMAVRRRALRFKGLHLFQGWPDQELGFLAHWCYERRFAAGASLYEIGDRVDGVHFLSTGAAGLCGINPDDPRGPLVHLEHIAPPFYVGEAEVVEAHATRTFKVVAIHNTVTTVIPLHVFKALVVDEYTYRSAARVRSILSERKQWHDIRYEDADTTADMPFALLAPTQSRIIGHPGTGAKGWLEFGHDGPDSDEDAAAAGGAGGDSPAASGDGKGTADDGLAWQGGDSPDASPESDKFPGDEKRGGGTGAAAALRATDSPLRRGMHKAASLSKSKLGFVATIARASSKFARFQPTRATTGRGDVMEAAAARAAAAASILSKEDYARLERSRSGRGVVLTGGAPQAAQQQQQQRRPGSRQNPEGIAAAAAAAAAAGATASSLPAGSGAAAAKRKPPMLQRRASSFVKRTPSLRGADLLTVTKASQPGTPVTTPTGTVPGGSSVGGDSRAVTPADGASVDSGVTVERRRRMSAMGLKLMHNAESGTGGAAGSGSGTPGGEDDWNVAKPRVTATEKERRKVADEAVSEMRVVMKAVQAFKRLLQKRRDREAAEHEAEEAVTRRARESAAARAQDASRLRRQRSEARREKEAEIQSEQVSGQLVSRPSMHSGGGLMRRPTSERVSRILSHRTMSMHARKHANGSGGAGGGHHGSGDDDDNLDDLHDGELLTSTRGLAASSHRLAETESFMMGGLGNGSRRVGEPDDLGASMRGSMRNGLGASSSGAHASRPGHVRHRTAGGRIGEAALAGIDSVGSGDMAATFGGIGSGNGGMGGMGAATLGGPLTSIDETTTAMNARGRVGARGMARGDPLAASARALPASSRRTPRVSAMSASPSLPVLSPQAGGAANSRSPAHVAGGGGLASTISPSFRASRHRSKSPEGAGSSRARHRRDRERSRSPEHASAGHGRHPRVSAMASGGGGFGADDPLSPVSTLTGGGTPLAASIIREDGTRGPAPLTPAQAQQAASARLAMSSRRLTPLSEGAPRHRHGGHRRHESAAPSTATWATDTLDETVSRLKTDAALLTQRRDEINELTGAEPTGADLGGAPELERTASGSRPHVRAPPALALAASRGASMRGGASAASMGGHHGGASPAVRLAAANSARRRQSIGGGDSAVDMAALASKASMSAPSSRRPSRYGGGRGHGQSMGAFPSMSELGAVHVDSDDEADGGGTDFGRDVATAMPHLDSGFIGSMRLED